MEDFLIIAILAVVLGGAIAYIIKAKKSGAKCIGCPAAGACGKTKSAGSCGGCISCNGSDGEEKESSESCSCNCQTDKLNMP